jgi:broad specificity phosphatase PhoE
MSQAVRHTRWWWIRHAPVPDGGRIYGQRDLDCDCTNTEIFRALAGELPRGAVWITSTLVRTTQTAAAIRAAAPQRFDGVSVVPVAELVEQDLGQWQGMQRAAFYAAHGVGTLNPWFAKADERAPGGESYSDLVSRVGPTIRRLTDEHGGGDIVCVSHGGTIRAALAVALDITADAVLHFTIENCSLTRIDHVGPISGAGLWRVGCVNHRPWSRMSAAAEHSGNPIGAEVAADKA